MGMLDSRGFQRPFRALTAEDEQRFVAWFNDLPFSKEFEQRYGEKPNPNDQSYDYRAAYAAGVEPTRYQFDGQYHWPSAAPNGELLKAVNHPTAWMQDFMESTGTDPNKLGIKNPYDAYLYVRGLR